MTTLKPPPQLAFAIFGLRIQQRAMPAAFRRKKLFVHLDSLAMCRSALQPEQLQPQMPERMSNPRSRARFLCPTPGTLSETCTLVVSVSGLFDGLCRYRRWECFPQPLAAGQWLCLPPLRLKLPSHAKHCLSRGPWPSGSISCFLMRPLPPSPQGSVSGHAYFTTSLRPAHLHLCRGTW